MLGFAAGAHRTTQARDFLCTAQKSLAGRWSRAYIRGVAALQQSIPTGS
jgi:hypothetical protein